MKKVCRFVLPILLLLSVEAKSQAYTYLPFPDSNVVWEMRIYHGAQGTTWATNSSVTISGDTIINNFTYHKIGGLGLREDSAKKIYYIELENTGLGESLLYDFSLSLGDTMDLRYPTSWVVTFKVANIDTVTYLGTPRRRLHLTSQYNVDDWIEGIGSTHGPLGILQQRFYDWCNGTTLCQSIQNDIITFQNSYTYCSSITSIPEHDFNVLITISPNPSTTSFTIQLSTPPPTQTYFQLYDALGKEVKREEIISETTTMPRNNLPSGIYFWQLQQGNKILDRGKVVME